MKLWLDDIRTPPDGWIWAKTAPEAIQRLIVGGIEEISLDHDLGDDEVGTGYTVACFIEEAAGNGMLKPLKWAIHSANPVGRKKMLAALESADRFWA